MKPYSDDSELAVGRNPIESSGSLFVFARKQYRKS